jgi:c-di-GMP-binding flagellar brake protein YcgR
MEENVFFKKLNQDIDLELRSETAVNVYPAKVLDVATETISVTAPREQGKLVPIDGGTRIKLIVVDGSVVFSFDSIVLGAKIEGTAPVLVLQKPAHMERTQRRTTFRVPTEQFPAEGKIIQGSAAIPFEAVCKEISGGGMMIVVDREIVSGTNLEVSFSLRGIPERFTVLGEAKRVEHLRRSGVSEYRVGVFFSNISDKMREKIIRYTFDQQRRLIQRGLI